MAAGKFRDRIGIDSLGSVPVYLKLLGREVFSSESSHATQFFGVPPGFLKLCQMVRALSHTSLSSLRIRVAVRSGCWGHFVAKALQGVRENTTRHHPGSYAESLLSLGISCNAWVCGACVCDGVLATVARRTANTKIFPKTPNMRARKRRKAFAGGPPTFATSPSKA